MKSIFSCSIASALAIACGVASAAPPANLAGTTWTVQVNRDSEQLVITAQGGPGAPGSAVCRVLVGTIGVAPVRGWYCPSTGRIHLRHNNLNSGYTMRVFSGNVSDEVIGQRQYMGGTVAIENAAFGDLGERNFAAIN